ncbi:STAS domain-containing protein [Nocardia otitidiscaviarum]|uniref:STAS domain-containing protein n=1 Tax=Nocardia otitidiscaviarum TaxID=1823 RepID=UPI0024553D68|nr:STAS domain-containing protein [Nocardia otitidiscaviarum]
MSAIDVLQRRVDADASPDSSHRPHRDYSDHESPPADNRRRGCTIVRVEGELDAAILSEFSEALDRAVTSSSRAVVIDFQQTRFLSIGSALTLAGATDTAAASGVELRVVATRREVERVLEVTGVGPQCHRYATVRAALEA